MTSKTCLFSTHINLRPLTEVSLQLADNNEHSFTQKLFSACTIKKLFKGLSIFDLFGRGWKKYFHIPSRIPFHWWD